ncbi:MAG: polyphosphate kinase 1, partial [Planctomycetota bacterium]
MKRVNRLKRRLRDRSPRLSLDGRTAQQELVACRQEIDVQSEILSRAVHDDILPRLAAEGLSIQDYGSLSAAQQARLRDYFSDSVRPILTPLAVDAEHPFPFISNAVLNLSFKVVDEQTGLRRFVRVKVPDNRPRWVPLGDGFGFVPLEQVIAANLDAMFPFCPLGTVSCFRVTRGADSEKDVAAEVDSVNSPEEPGSIVRQVSDELLQRRFADAVRLQVDSDMPNRMADWLAEQIDLEPDDVYRNGGYLSMSDLLAFPAPDRDDLRFEPHQPTVHPRLSRLPRGDDEAIFREISHGDILLHHPYHSFDASVLRFIESASVDPLVLAIKLTIYRTSKESPIIQALAQAARRGKQVAVLVEITARFDEAPNIAWGKFLENAGVHVAYGVEKLKTHVKLALVVREEKGQIRRYAHVGTGNYHTGTARIYEDLGVLTAHPEICEDVATVFNDLTAATHARSYHQMLVAPHAMRRRFVDLIRREAEHARQGRPAGIDAKMNQLQDPEIIRELYLAGQAGTPIRLVVRGLCCLRPETPGLSENIRVMSVLGRFLEHSRVYRFANGGDPEYFLGSADWMHRNLTNRVETIMPVLDAAVRAELSDILDV